MERRPFSLRTSPRLGFPHTLPPFGHWYNPSEPSSPGLLAIVKESQSTDRLEPSIKVQQGNIIYENSSHSRHKPCCSVVL